MGVGKMNICGFEVKNLLLAPNKSPELETGVFADKYPLYASAKFDGFRALCRPNGIVSRNHNIFSGAIHRHLLKLYNYCNYERVVIDGELYAPGVPFDKLAKCLKSKSGPIVPGLKLFVFDLLTVDEWNNETEPKFEHRYARYWNRLKRLQFPNVVAVPQFLCNSDTDVKECFNHSINNGFEGLMLRNPVSLYKHGRATMRQNIIYKLKQWVNVDSKIVGFNQMKQKGVLINKVGSFVLSSSDGIEYNAKAAANVAIPNSWDSRKQLLGAWVECRFMKHGVKNKPRFAHITRLRPDLSDSDNIEPLSSILKA